MDRIETQAATVEQLILGLGFLSWFGGLFMLVMGLELYAAIIWALVPAWRFFSIRWLKRTLRQTMRAELEQMGQSPQVRLHLHPSSRGGAPPPAN